MKILYSLIVCWLSFPMMQNIFRDLESGHMETGQGQILEATVKIAHTLLARKNMQPVFPPCWIIGSFGIIDL